ncbi:Fur family transcriptional regulator [Algivirga pacifica]|uniref:Transcriptional regulator n=1 Tax=Algivirga pacifica TaxID=1162670 RepID=A0ABP9DDT0_9BACT
MDEQKLENRNIKPTPIRILVLRTLLNSSVALSLSDIEMVLERADKATLYRTLKTFEEKKLIHSIDDGTGAVKYAICEENCECKPQDQHIHFHCVKCKETYCLSHAKIPQTKVPSGFKADSVNMVYRGTCASCS